MPTTVYDKSATLAGTDDGDSDGTTNQRIVHTAAVLGAATGNQIRLTLLFGTGCATVTGALSSVFVGQGAGTGNDWNFIGDQVQVTFSGGNTVNSSAAGSVVSNFVTLAQNYDNTKNYVVAYHFISASSLSTSTAAVTGVNSTIDSGGADSASQTTPAGMTEFANFGSLVTKIEIQASGGFVPYNPWPQAAPVLAT